MKSMIKVSILAMVLLAYPLLAFVSLTFPSHLLWLTEYLPIVTAIVPTSSMVPTIDQRDVIFVDTRMEFDDIVLDDIVVFHAPVGIVVHRVIGFDDGDLITQGDNNPNPDVLHITESMHVGSVIYILKGGLYLAVLIIGCSFGWSVFDKWQKVKRRQNM